MFYIRGAPRPRQRDFVRIYARDAPARGKIVSCSCRARIDAGAQGNARLPGQRARANETGAASRAQPNGTGCRGGRRLVS
jgi:hypothetical protein